MKTIKLERFSGAVDSIDNERGLIRGVAGGIRLECEGLSVQEALTMAQAAPEMLKALKAAEGALSWMATEKDDHTKRKPMTVTGAAIKQALAAIAKAEGRMS